MRYNIAVYQGHGPISDGPVENYTRRRCDAASLLLETIVYRLIRNSAGLDTKRGQKAHARGQEIIRARGGVVCIGDYSVFYTVSRT